MPFIDTMRSEYDFLVFIGRFQIPHHGHFHIIKEALKKADKLIIGIGSSNLSRSLKNPFTFAERVDMIVESGDPEIKEAYDSDRIIFQPIDDMPYKEQKWIVQVVNKVRDTTRNNRARVGLIGCSKDASSYYLKMFPMWPNVSVPVQGNYNSTECRNGFFELTNYEPTSAIKKMYEFTTPKVVGYLTGWMMKNNEQYVAFQKEHAFIKHYKKSWEVAPFPPTFATVDAVVFHKGNVLVIERGDYPGKGLLACPGGFLDQEETQLQGFFRELKEETNLKITYPDIDYGISVELSPWLVEEKTFGLPGRDGRGRTITQAFCLELPPLCTPVIQAGDDAAAVSWRPWKDLKANQFIADHFFIIEYFAERYLV